MHTDRLREYLKQNNCSTFIQPVVVFSNTSNIDAITYDASTICLGQAKQIKNKIDKIISKKPIVISVENVYNILWKAANAPMDVRKRHLRMVSGREEIKNMNYQNK